MAKSILLTYFLWLTGGIFGLHHFYLGRDLQGFVWWCTIGGYLAGWLRDFFFIPQYVKAANHDPDYTKNHAKEVHFFKTPPFSAWRYGGGICMAYLFSSIFQASIPKDEFLGFTQWHYLYYLIPFAVATGVWLVGNIGHEEGPIIYPLIGAYITYPFYKYYPGELSFTSMILASSQLFDWYSKRWRRQVKPPKHILKRTAVLVTCGCIYLALWTGNIYFNGSVTDSDGEEIPIRELIHHFFTSPWWNELSRCLTDIWSFTRDHSWDEVWKKVVELMDPHGEQNAYAVLGITIEANQTSINSKCRQLAVKWHPDRFHDEQEKLEAQEKFYEIQQACEILSTSKAKRRRNNKKSVKDDL